MARTKGAYVTKGRAHELEKQIEACRRELGERVAHAEARAEAAERRATEIFEAILRTRKAAA